MKISQLAVPNPNNKQVLNIAASVQITAINPQWLPDGASIHQTADHALRRTVNGVMICERVAYVMHHYHICPARNGFCVHKKKGYWVESYYDRVGLPSSAWLAAVGADGGSPRKNYE